MQLTDRGIVQVSMNLTNYEQTPISAVFESVKREAARYGVRGAGERNRRAGSVSRARPRAAQFTCRSRGSSRPDAREAAADSLTNED